MNMNEPIAKRPKHENLPFPEKNQDTFESADFDMSDMSINNDKAYWCRNPVNMKLDGSEDIDFQHFDLDSYVIYDQLNSLSYSKGVVQNGSLTIIRFFGVTAGGNSVCIHVHGYETYFYITAPKRFAQNDCETLKDKLNLEIMNRERNKRTGAYTGSMPPVSNIKLVYKKSIYGYSPDEKTCFIQIFVCMHKFINVITNIFSSGFTCPGYGQWIYCVYESNVDVGLKFLVDKDIMGCSWLRLPSYKYKLRDSLDTLTIHDNTLKKVSTCQIECDIYWKELVSLGCDNEWAKVSPFRVLSFDIECAGRKGIFPEPNHDPVIQIANIVLQYGNQDSIIRNVFTFKKCASIANATVYSFDKEEDLLAEWAKFIVMMDADIITGYNIENFDFPYLINRASHLRVDSFPFLGRIVGIKSKIVDSSISSKQMGRREGKTVRLCGRIQYDLYMIIQRNFKLRSYTLNSVSYHFLQQQKEDVHYSIITQLQNKDEFTRRRLAVYCIKDAKLPLLLIDKLMLLVNSIEMARVTGVGIGQLLTRGEQIKVFSQLLRETHKQDLLIPVGKKMDNEEFEGATVIEPERGYYDVPIATLDFSSLYPSIMIANNLCYTTLLSTESIVRYGLTENDYVKSPSGNYFAVESLHCGLLPKILSNLLSSRKRVKNMLKEEIDSFKRRVLDGRQLAIKLVANSVYGFTGAQVGKLPCMEISQSVTAYGRQMIDSTKCLVEQLYCKEKGYQHDCKVIYGDTDSVMCRFGVSTVEEAMVLGKSAADEISKHFKAPIKLEFEKVYYPYLLINKKRYAGIYWTKPDAPDKMDCKGIETVRRDNCPLVSKVITRCLRMLLYDRDKQGAIDYVKRVISDLLCNRVDISQLVISKELRKKDSEYVAKQAHTELANKMKKRDPGKAPKLGDRVPYIICAGSKKAAAYERAEDPLYALENEIPIDTKYYLENQLHKPLLRIFEPILGDRADSILFRGEHTLHKSITTAKNIGIAAFAIKRNCCVGCKAVLKRDDTNICNYCEPKRGQLYADTMKKMRTFERKNSQLWSHCQKCQDSTQQEIICSNIDCPIFFMRTKVSKDVEKTSKLLEKFNISKNE